MAKYRYDYTNERGNFYGFVEDKNGTNIWEVKYPDFYEDEETGEIIEASTIFEDGFMKDADDIEGLEKYLKDINLIEQDDEIVTEDIEDEESHLEDLSNELNIPIEVLMEYADNMGLEYNELSDDVPFYGRFNSIGDFAESLVQDGVISNLVSYAYITNTDKRLFASEEADNYVDNLDDDEIEREREEDEDIEDTRSRLVDDEYERVLSALNREGVDYLIDNFGYSDSDLLDLSIVNIDYDDIARDLEIEGSYGYIYHDGDVFVFSEFKNGGFVLASGGSLETKLKGKLKDSFALPLEVAVYVPSTKKANEIISKKEFNNRINEVETYLSKLFGGYSASSIDGGYMSDDKEKGLIQEDVARVVSFGQKDGFEDKFDELINKISDWCRDWSQESIGLEFEGDMFYVSEGAKFGHGGITMAKGGHITDVKNKMIEYIDKEYRETREDNYVSVDYVISKVKNENQLGRGYRNVDFDSRVYNTLNLGKKMGLFYEINDKRNKKIGYWINDKYADGGEIADSNNEMLLSQIKAVKHHAEELSEIVNAQTDVEAWVVGKIERASTDLSDITHYLDGKKMAHGGMMAKGGGFDQYGNPYGFDDEMDSLYEWHYKEDDKVNPYKVWDKMEGVYVADFPNRQRAIEWIERRDSGYADGGETKKKFSVVFLIMDDDNYEDNEPKTIQIVEIVEATDRRDAISKGVLQAREKNPDLRISEFECYGAREIKADEMARGRKLDEYETYHQTLASALDEAERFVNNRGYEFSEDRYFPDLTSGGVPYGQTISTRRDLIEIGGKNRTNTLLVQVYRMDSGTYELNMYFAKSNYAKGGSLENQYKGKTPKQVWESMSNKQKAHFIHDHKEEISIHDSGMDLEYFEKYIVDWSELQEQTKEALKNHVKMGSYAKGGDVKNPTKKQMLDYLNMYFDYYSELRTIAIEEDNILTKKMLPTLDDEQIEMAYEDAKYEIKADTEMAKGGELKQGDKVIFRGDEYRISKITNENVVGFIDTKWYLDSDKIGIRPIVLDSPKEIIKMADGGVTFDDKVESISKSLLKRKKVSPKVQKDYGKTYDKKEAIESAKRIAGAMRKKKN